MSSRLEELTKKAVENILFDMNFEKRLFSGEIIDGITSVSFVNEGKVSGSADITLGSNSFLNNIAQVRISAGEAKEQYTITFIVTTDAANTRTGSGLLRVT